MIIVTSKYVDSILSHGFCPEHWCHNFPLFSNHKSSNKSTEIQINIFSHDRWLIFEKNKHDSVSFLNESTV